MKKITLKVAIAILTLLHLTSCARLSMNGYEFDRNFEDFSLQTDSYYRPSKPFDLDKPIFHRGKVYKVEKRVNPRHFTWATHEVKHKTMIYLIESVDSHICSTQLAWQIASDLYATAYRVRKHPYYRYEKCQIEPNRGIK